MKLVRLLLCAALLLTPAFAQTGNSADAKEIDKLSRDFEAASAKKDAAAIGQMYAKDARMLGGGMPSVSGREAIQKAWKDMFDAGFADLKLMTTSLERQGNVLIEVGTWTASMGGKPDKGKFVVIYKKEGGKWKLWVDSFSSDTGA